MILCLRVHSVDEYNRPIPKTFVIDHPDYYAQDHDFMKVVHRIWKEEDCFKVQVYENNQTISCYPFHQVINWIELVNQINKENCEKQPVGLGALFG